MRRLKTVVTLVLALLWLPATAHCGLESLPGLDFLSCCTHAEEEKTPAHHEDDCAGDSCATVESGFHLPDTSVEVFAKPVLMAAEAALTAPTETLSASGPPADNLSCAPPELARIWQFSLRAAWPPRAPSLP